MKSINKILSMICIFSMLALSFAMYPIVTVAYDEPVIPDDWVDPEFSTDHAYSFAFVGDTQFLTIGDYMNGTDTMDRLYSYIADTAEERKLEHVFVLGDMVHLGYKNDVNLSNLQFGATGTGEWEVVKRAISKLDGVVPYSLVRGNHDDYTMDEYFYQPEYTSQFDGCGGFYSDTGAKYDSWLASLSHSGYIYYGAKSKSVHDYSVANSWKTVRIGETDYLFMTIDYNPTDNMIKWANETLAAFPNHKAIVTTHSLLNSKGETIDYEEDDSSYKYFNGNDGNDIWEKCLSLHANVQMVVCGHVGVNNVHYSYDRGVNGNKVLQMIVDPQAYDYDDDGKVGKQDTGMVLYMNFSADGKTVNFDYYSTLLGKMKKKNNHTVYLGDEPVVREGDIDFTDLGEYGQQNAVLSVKSKVAPTLNGTIAANEYLVTKTTKADSNNKLESDLTEYFAYDDDYIYYAFTTKQSTAGQSMQLNFRPNYDKANISELEKKHYLRMQINYIINEDGTHTKSNNSTMIPPTNVDNSPSMSYIHWDRDVFISTSRNPDTLYNVVEFKLSRDYFEMNCGGLDSLAYILFLGKNPENQEMWLRWSDSQSKAALVANGVKNFNPFLYYYMVFDDSVVSTRETASVRLSTENNGIRFKTEIETYTLNHLIASYGKENVQIGTLITPLDYLNGKALTHEFGEVGKDFVDVVANIDAPYATEGDSTVFAGSLVNIHKGNLDRDFAAVGYIKVTDGGVSTYYYSDVMASRNVSDVAEAAYFDLKTTETNGYKNLVDASADVGYGLYSPYTTEQRAILKSLIVDKMSDVEDPSVPDEF